ncbi:MAG TPA: 16S rRNA (adenine(1518)-N(6)/adenine(1519)-N(6))-dimethyltransferase RsmA [Candidatus Limnocylindrales bacterium]|nr:16S rRNA (adenine(1518)-N(6)/adenine(1519)-N(6))-dimethyltransferase RsmA [Candidatus Limnocylindrales bacterium]
MPTLYEEVRAMLRDSEFRPRKSRGQNFLIHEHVIDAILRLLDLQPGDEVVEIGPGLGFVTRRLVERAQKVWAVEIDELLAQRLVAGELGTSGRFHLIYGDILQVRLPELLPSTKVKLVGNLPYNIATEVLFRIFDWREHFSALVLMVQKEVADRMISDPGSKSYGTLSVWCQVHARISEKIDVSSEAFYPRPKVRSTILKIELLPEPLVCEKNLPVLKGLVRAAFGQRRKTLSNAVGSWLTCAREEIDELLAIHGIDPKRRGETLSVNEFSKLAQAIRQSGLLAATA